MKLKAIKTEDENLKALERLESIFDSNKNSKNADELELLSILIEKYENENFPRELPDPIEAIKFRMEQMSNSQK